MVVFAKHLLINEAWLDNCLIRIEEGIISSIQQNASAGIHIDASADIITSGLFDSHIHGGDRFDSAHATVDGMESWLKNLRKCGVSAILVTLSSQPISDIRKSLSVVQSVINRQKTTDGAKVMGVHLEGPFINPNKGGAMNVSSIQVPSKKTCKQILEGYENIVRLMSLAPELPESGEVIRILQEHQIGVQIGHSMATFEEGEKAFKDGVQSVCHFFNAAPCIHHRKPGFLTAALLDDRIYCEIIGDLEHVHAGAIKLLYRCKGSKHLILISDAVPATNLPDGTYELENKQVIVKNGISRLPNGTLNGGGTYLPGAVKNLYSIGIPLNQIIDMASKNVAKRLNLFIPEIKVGEPAFLLAWNTMLTPEFTIIGDSLEVCTQGEKDWN